MPCNRPGGRFYGRLRYPASRPSAPGWRFASWRPRVQHRSLGEAAHAIGIWPKT